MSSMMNVAREANVAVSTVSLALNHSDRVHPTTRKRIEEAMRRVGYRPRNKDNVDEFTGTSVKIAFIYTLESLSPIEDKGMSSYCREVIAGLQEEMAGSASALSIFRGVEHVDQDIMVNEQIRASEFDGVVLFGADPRNGYLERLQCSGIPLVVMNRPPEHGRFSCVTLDYYGGAQIAIEHLHSLGHRRIAVQMNDESGKWLLREIRQGAFDAMGVHGLAPVVDYRGIIETLSEEHIALFCEQVVEQKATAIFAGDHLVVRCADRLTQMGVRVPDDISLLGFDDRGLVTSAGLSLTTIGYDKRRMGRMAVQMLQKLARSRGKLRWLAGAVSTHVVQGQTTAKVASVVDEA